MSSSSETSSQRSSLSDESLTETFDNEIRGYVKEPELDEVGSSSSSDDSDVIDEDEQNLRLDYRDWCKCGNCCNMPTYRERICCFEIDASRNRLREGVTHYYHNDNFQCITSHPGFINNCLLWEVLDNVYGFFRQYCGRQPHADNDNKRRRYTAYRQLARFLHGVVGKDNRLVHPACAVYRIRDTFKKPAEQQFYTGFIDNA